MIKNTGRAYREANRARLKKYYDKQKDLGNKRVSILLSGDTHALLVAERDKLNISQSDIIEQALNERFNPTMTREPGPIDQDIDDIPDCHGKKLSQCELDEILLKVDELYPRGGEGNPQRRVDALNDSGVGLRNKQLKFGSVHWDKKKVASNIVHAKKRLKKKLNPSSE